MDDWLRSLDAKLLNEVPAPRFGKDKVFPVCNNEPISEDEVSRVLGLLNGEDYAMCPTNINMGFREAFSLYKLVAITPGVPLEAKRVLTFSYRQMPDSVSWQSMAEHYMASRNLELLELAGFNEPKPEQSHYMY